MLLNERKLKNIVQSVLMENSFIGIAECWHLYMKIIHSESKIEEQNYTNILWYEPWYVPNNEDIAMIDFNEGILKDKAIRYPEFLVKRYFRTFFNSSGMQHEENYEVCEVSVIDGHRCVLSSNDEYEVLEKLTDLIESKYPKFMNDMN